MSVPKVRKEFVRCRTIGHAWDALAHTPGKAEIRLRCTSCTMERFDVVDTATGAVRSRRYEAPVGYYLSDGVEAPAKDEWRLHFFVVAGIVDGRGRLK